MGTPVWSHDGIICTGESYKSVVKLTFARGASLKDPARLFNSSLDGNVRRAIDIHEGEEVDESAFKALVRQAAAVERRASRAAVARAAGTGRRHPRRPERRTVARKPEGPRSQTHERRDGRYLGVGPRNTNCQPAAQSGLGPCMSIWGGDQSATGKVDAAVAGREMHLRLRKWRCMDYSSYFRRAALVASCSRDCGDRSQPRLHRRPPYQVIEASAITMKKAFLFYPLAKLFRKE